MIFRGVVNLVASLAGVGKSLISLYIALQAARPDGGWFLGRRILPTATVIVNYDNPGDGRAVLYWLEKLRRDVPDADLDKIIVLEPDMDDYAFSDASLAQVRDVATAARARMVILDSFMAAYPAMNLVKTSDVYEGMFRLRRLAQQLDAALVVIDHLPKNMAGEKVGARGVIGSVAKPAQARSVHLLTKVPPREVEGRYVLRWEVSKLSYGPVPEPFGVEVVIDQEGARLAPMELPDEYAGSRTEKASRAIQAALEASAGLVVNRKDLLDRAISEANVSLRTAESALKETLERLGDDVMPVKLPGRGSPVGYRFVVGVAE